MEKLAVVLFFALSTTLILYRLFLDKKVMYTGFLQNKRVTLDTFCLSAILFGSSVIQFVIILLFIILYETRTNDYIYYCLALYVAKTIFFFLLTHKISRYKHKQRLTVNVLILAEVLFFIFFILALFYSVSFALS